MLHRCVGMSEKRQIIGAYERIYQFKKDTLAFINRKIYAALDL